MNIGIDLDDTITDVPVIFQLLTHAICECVPAKHTIHIITYRDEADRKQTEKEVLKLGVSFHHLHLAPQGVDAPQWKAKLAKELKLDIMFDDSPEVLAAMPENVKRFWICDPEIFNLKVCLKALKDHNKLPIIK